MGEGAVVPDAALELLVAGIADWLPAVSADGLADLAARLRLRPAGLLHHLDVAAVYPSVERVFNGVHGSTSSLVPPRSRTRCAGAPVFPSARASRRERRGLGGGFCPQPEPVLQHGEEVGHPPRQRPTHQATTLPDDGAGVVEQGDEGVPADARTAEQVQRARGRRASPRPARQH